MASAAQPANVAPDDESIETMTREEGLELLGRQVRNYLGMSGNEFVQRYRAGQIEDPDRLEVARVAILLPLADLQVCSAQLHTKPGPQYDANVVSS